MPLFLFAAPLDIIGLIPTSDEARRFLTDKDPTSAPLVDEVA